MSNPLYALTVIHYPTDPYYGPTIKLVGVFATRSRANMLAEKYSRVGDRKGGLYWSVRIEEVPYNTEVEAVAYFEDE